MKTRKQVSLGAPQPGTKWTHHSGREYIVDLIANGDTERPDDYPVTVVYRDLDSGKVWCRPASDWPRSFVEKVEDQIQEWEPNVMTKCEIVNPNKLGVEYGKHLVDSGSPVIVMANFESTHGVPVTAVDHCGSCYVFRSEMVRPLRTKEQRDREELAELINKRGLCKSTTLADAIFSRFDVVRKSDKV